MKRAILVLAAGTILAGLLASEAVAGDEVARPIGRIETTERYSWGEFGRDLNRLRADLALAQASVFGGTEWREETCRFQSLERPTWTQREEDLTAACVVERLGPIEGGLTRLLAIGSCESGWNRLASNGGRYLGLFQHAASYWSSRTGLIPERWRIGNWTSWTNSRAQIVVTVRMVRASGWSAWSCA